MIKKLLLLLSFVLLTSCSFSKKDEPISLQLIDSSYRAVDSMLKHINDYHFNKDRPLLVASFVDIDDVRRSSTMGRLIAEQIGSRLTQKGYKVIEMKLRDSVFVQKRNGEFLLSREILDISKVHDAYAVVVGTYGIIPDSQQTYVTSKLVRARDSVILSSFDFSLPMVNVKGRRRY